MIHIFKGFVFPACMKMYRTERLLCVYKWCGRHGVRVGGCRGMERESSREEVTVISQNCLSVKWVSTGEETQVVYNEIYTNFKHTAFTLSKQAGKPSIWKVKELTKEKVRNSLAYLVPAPVQQLSQGIHHLIPTDDLCRGRGQNSWAPRQICLGEKGFLGLETTFTSHLFMK